MASEDERIKTLEMKIKDLETQLGRARQPAPATDITADELEAYRKVRDVIAFDYGDFCGVNDCFRCIQLCRPAALCDRVCARCDVECYCGPCNAGSLGRVGISRFGGLGG